MNIIKSEINTNSASFTAKQDSTVKELLEQSGIRYQLRENELIELDGVIATASKGWNVYVNDVKTDLNTPVKSGGKMEWKYEPKY